ncbi:hypothetical protein V8E36_006819 [Tilletia maclaganii]
MQLYVTPIILTVFFAVAVNAYDDGKHLECFFKAYNYCNQSVSAIRSDPWNVVYSACMTKYWTGLPSDGKCPHPTVGCSCYQGCVQDRWDMVKDVGGWCTKACKAGTQQVKPCQP